MERYLIEARIAIYRLASFSVWRAKFVSWYRNWGRRDSLASTEAKAAIANLSIQKFRGFVLISGREGDDAQPYQEKQVRNALRQVQS